MRRKPSAKLAPAAQFLHAVQYRPPMTSILRVALPVPLPMLFDYREGDTPAAVGSRECGWEA